MNEEKWKKSQEIIFIHIYSQTVCEARLIEAQDDLKKVRARLMVLEGQKNSKAIFGIINSSKNQTKDLKKLS